MNEPLNCPSCNVSLLGDPIPEKWRDSYAGKHWKREIALYDLNRDRTTSYRCPDCGHEWPR